MVQENFALYTKSQNSPECHISPFSMCPLARVCVVYVVKEAESFSGVLGQLMGVARNITRARALLIVLSLLQQEERKKAAT